jgi:type I restriction enzyme, S subunit
VNEYPGHWIRVPLEDVVEVRDDLREPVNAKDRANRVGPYPYYGATGQVGWIDGYRMEGEYVLLGEDGAPFFDPDKPKAYVVSGKSWVNNHAHVLRGVEDVLENRYLLYALNSTDYRGFVNGTTRPKLTQGAMRRIPLNIAPIEEQRRIVEKLEELFSDLDAGVAALERVRAKLRRYRASVLKAAVEGQLTADWRAAHPDVEPASELLPRISAERRRRWEEDQLAKCAESGKQPPKHWESRYQDPAAPEGLSLPPLPAGWCWASVSQLLDETSCNGISVKGSDHPPGTPALRLNAMSESGFDYSARRYIPIRDEVAEELAIHEGDFFVARGNGSLHLVGRGTLAQSPPERIVFPDTMIRLRFNGLYPLRRFIAILWQTELVRDQVEKRARTTAGIYKISQRDLDAFVLPLPPLAEQAAVLEIVEHAVSIVDQLDGQIDGDQKRATRLRQSILKRAFEGRLVPQDPDDEPATRLLERIREEREGSIPRTRRGQKRGDADSLPLFDQ